MDGRVACSHNSHWSLQTKRQQGQEVRRVVGMVVFASHAHQYQRYYAGYYAETTWKDEDAGIALENLEGQDIVVASHRQVLSSSYIFSDLLAN